MAVQGASADTGLTVNRPALVDRVRSSLDGLRVAPGSTLAIACSGGADSVALLHLSALAHPEIVVLHVDHGLRGDSASDASFVRAAAEALGVRFASTQVCVDTSTGSVEAAAREARYDALRAMAAANGCDHVATGHTLDDQAETVLLRLMRGGSLSAIAPRRGGFVRPLLSIRRDELRAWLESNAIAWREDPTNEDLRFERNWVRSALLPLMETRRSGVAAVLARTADRHREDALALEAIASSVFERASVDDIGVFVDSAEFDLLPVAIADRVVRRAFRTAGHDPSHPDLEAVRHLRSGRVRAGGVDVWRFADGLAFLRTDARLPGPVGLPMRGQLSCGEWGVRVRVGAGSEDPWAWRTHAPAGQLVIRAREPGDRVRTRSGKRKVQDMLVDAKVPRPLRGLVPLLLCDDEVVAVVGHDCQVGVSTPLSASGRVVDVEPFSPTWSRERAWSSR